MTDPATTGRPPAAPRVLIVRPSALGDVARTVPALATLRRAMPEARIDWLVVDAFADVVRHHPMLDDVVAFPRKRLAGFGRRWAPTRAGAAMARELRSRRYDRVYDLQGLARSGLLTRLTGAARRVGFADARELGWLGYNVRHRVEGCRHTVDRMLGLLAADGLEPVRDMRLYVGDQDRAWLERFRDKTGIADGYACLAPTARWPSKCWPVQRYAELTARLLESGAGGEHVVVLASPTEREQVRPLLNDLSPGHRERVHFPETSVGQLMAVLSRASLLVANDSAALHIAVGLDRPTVAIFGPTDPGEVGPYGRAEAVVRSAVAERVDARQRRDRHDTSLIRQVEVEAVWEAARRELEQAAQGDGPVR